MMEYRIWVLHCIKLFNSLNELKVLQDSVKNDKTIN